MKLNAASVALAFACALPQPAFAEVAPLPGNEAAWAAEDGCQPRIPVRPIADIPIEGVTRYPGVYGFRKSVSLAGVDLEGVDVNVIGDDTVVRLTDIRVHHVGGGHFFVTGYDEGGNFGGNPKLYLDHADIDFAGAQNLSQGNITNNYTAGATSSELHISHACLYNAPSDYLSNFYGGTLTVTDTHISAMCRAAKIENGDHCEAAHINGGKNYFKNVMFDMAANGGVPCCITSVLFLDAISTGYDIDFTCNHCVIKGMQSQGFLYPIYLSPGHANVVLHLCNTDIEPGIHGQFVAGIGPYGAFNAKVMDCGGNRNAATGDHIVLGIPEAPPAPDPAPAPAPVPAPAPQPIPPPVPTPTPPSPTDARDAQIASLQTQVTVLQANVLTLQAQVNASVILTAQLNGTISRYSSGLQRIVVLGTAANATHQGPTKGQVAGILSTAKTTLANH